MTRVPAVSGTVCAMAGMRLGRLHFGQILQSQVSGGHQYERLNHTQ